METRTIARTDTADLTIWTIEVRGDLVQFTGGALTGPEVVTLVADADGDDYMVLPTGEHLLLTHGRDLVDSPWLDVVDAVCEHVVENA